MKVYLDNNVLVDIEDGRYTVNDFLAKDAEYYFSDAHMNEILEAIGNPKVSQGKRLELISEICGRNCILSGGYREPEVIMMDPIDMYRLSNTPLISHINKVVSNGAGVFERIREVLGFDSKIFNNENPENVLRILNQRMQEVLHIGLEQYLMRSEAFGGRVLFITLLNIIDAANYWGDVKSDHSEVARLNDSSHAYFAQICDVLVTNDKRMRSKIKAIYSFLGIKTKVLSVKEFFAL